MNVLYVEDDPDDAELTRRELGQRAPRIRVDAVATQREALARPEQPATYDLVLTDRRLPDDDALAILAHIREQALPLAVVIITGVGDEETAVAALKAGADDYVTKRGDYLAHLPHTLETTLRLYRAEAGRRASETRAWFRKAGS